MHGGTDKYKEAALRPKFALYGVHFFRAKMGWLTHTMPVIVRIRRFESKLVAKARQGQGCSETVERHNQKSRCLPKTSDPRFFQTDYCLLNGEQQLFC